MKMTETQSDGFNSVLSTKDNIKNLIDDIEQLTKELICQTFESSKSRQYSAASESQNNLLQITKQIIQKQNQLNNYLSIANEQQTLYSKINQVKDSLVKSDSDIKSLLLYLKEAEQVLASAVYQSKLKLDMIKKSQPLPSDVIIRYAHKISSEFGVCCPENWAGDNPYRPYPTDADMRRGWLAKLSNFVDLNLEPESQNNAQQLLRSNSKLIEPIVPQEFKSNQQINSLLP
ncbi:mediator of RNA polymerase II transcription subunit 4, partial [Brachionus plicatilis]